MDSAHCLENIDHHFDTDYNFDNHYFLCDKNKNTSVENIVDIKVDNI